MSWSVSRTGTPHEVRAKLASDIRNARCLEPEESIKAKVGEIFDLSLTAYPDNAQVKVSAWGSQIRAPNDRWINTLTVQIENLPPVAK